MVALNLFHEIEEYEGFGNEYFISGFADSILSTISMEYTIRLKIRIRKRKRKRKRTNYYSYFPRTCLIPRISAVQEPNIPDDFNEEGSKVIAYLSKLTSFIESIRRGDIAIDPLLFCTPFFRFWNLFFKWEGEGDRGRGSGGWKRIWTSTNWQRFFQRVSITLLFCSPAVSFVGSYIFVVGSQLARDTLGSLLWILSSSSPGIIGSCAVDIRRDWAWPSGEGIYTTTSGPSRGEGRITVWWKQERKEERKKEKKKEGGKEYINKWLMI